MNYFNVSMNRHETVKIENEAARVFEKLLRDIPRLEMMQVEREAAVGRDEQVDIIVTAHYADKPLTFVIEVKSNGQPRMMQSAALQLKHYIDGQDDDFVPVVMAPYMSALARDVCRREGVGYVDFLGNAHIAVDTIFIDRQVAERPKPERRALRSLFKPKSARILRMLLHDPRRSWRVAELAEEAKVSIGHVSTVGSALRERGWAEMGGAGLTLTDPDDLLESWADSYEPPQGKEVRRYSHLQGKALADRLRSLPMSGGRAVLASYSAADWLAPYVRQQTTYLYADEAGFNALASGLDLAPAAKGANVVVRIPDEDGVLDDVVEVSDGIFATSPVQTYLDLMNAGERGQEGAQHLRAKLLEWNA